jgi:hypothetical protein
VRNSATLNVVGVQIENPAVAALLPGNAEGLALGGFLVVAQLQRHAEDPDRQAQLVVLGEIDQVGLGVGPPLEDLREGEIRLSESPSAPSDSRYGCSRLVLFPRRDRINPVLS